MLESKKFFGVYISRDSNSYDKPNDQERLHVYTSYDQVAAVLKDNKNARFKIFNSENEACYFALHGSVGGQGNPNVISESIPFKSLKRPEIYRFRRCIENDDFTSVKTLIWENPRYLISIGDTPTIMQEGPRYNALHIIAKHNRARIAELILSTVSNPCFTKLLYGAAGENSYIVRPEVLVDLYLNTPDKSLNETPLHFAAKYGAVEVIAVFIQYPQLKINVKNKYNQTPKDITCKQAAGESTKLTNKIHKMLNELFYVPVWRSSDDIVQPVIGKPYSPKSPPVCPGVTSPVSPSMEIKAIAGPMTYSEANDFHKTWKSPVRSANCTSPNTPHLSQGVLLRSPLEMERGLEKVGRTLATKFHVSWREHWPFLDRFVDLRSEEGLKALEEYLKEKISVQKSPVKVNANDDVLTPISELCNFFAKCSINSPNYEQSPLSSLVPELKSAGDVAHAPYLLIENICVTFVDSILETFSKNFLDQMPIEDNVVALIKKVRNLIVSLNGCKKDAIFKNFPFGKVHYRIAQWITRRLCKLNERCLTYATSTFRLIHQTEAYVMVRRITLSPTSSVLEVENIVQNLKCINSEVIKLLSGLVIRGDKPIDETTCRKEWSSIAECHCAVANDGILSRLHRLGREVRKKILFSDDEDVQNDDNKKTQVTTNSATNCDNQSKLPIEKICDNERHFDSDEEDDGEEFFTPPSSLSTSDDEMDSPDEGPEIFIYDNKGTSMDNAVLEAIDDVPIDRDCYPNIYRWKHSVQLYKTMDRFAWPSPKSSKNMKQKSSRCIGK